MPTISVIIPVYNHSKALAKSLRSLSVQTLRPSEVIVIDDGSTDGNVEKVLSKAELYCAIKYIAQKNAGAAAARNRGFKEATGEYIIFWDADTIAKPEMLERLEKALQATPEASYAYCSYRFGWKKMPAKEFSREDLLYINYIDTTSLIKREALVGVAGPFDESLKRFQDWDLWLTLLKKGRVGVFVPQILFRKLVGLRKGYSSWIPKFFYRSAWRTKKLKRFDEARRVIVTKHDLPM